MTNPKPKAPLTCDTRRQEAKRQRSEASGTLWQRLSRRVSPHHLLIWTGFYVAATAILLAGRESMSWRLMQRVDRDIVARVPFAVEAQLETKENRRAARAAVPQIYVANDTPLAAIQNKLTELRDLAHSAEGDPNRFFNEATSRGWVVTEPVWRAMQEFVSDDKALGRWDELVKRLSDRLEGEYLVDRVGDGGPLPPALKSELRRPRRASVEVATTDLRVATRENVEELARQSAAGIFPEPLRVQVAGVIAGALISPAAGEGKRAAYVPLWRYEANATAEARRQAEERVPPVMRSFKAGDILVSSASVRRLSANELDLLKQEHQAFTRARQTEPALRNRYLAQQSGMAVLVLLMTLALASYSSLYERRTFHLPAHTLGLCSLMLVMLGASRLLEIPEYPYDLAPEFSVAPVVIATALMTIAFTQRFAFGGGGVLVILTTLAARGDFNLYLTLMAAMAMTIFLLREVRTRSKVIAVGAAAGLVAMLTSASASFIIGEELRYVLMHALVAGGAALAGGFIVQGILPNFERLFGVATSMTLLEWCDASRPLLRLLAQNAPGTYSHSLIISQMADEAAESIGARGLLARVGALYHDIGKASKPEYFVENQEAKINRHDRLSPTMSLLILVGHVKDGLEMARAYGLPKVLHQFITEHHGTTVIRYFHRAAQEAEAAARNKRFCDRDVPESEFRYPGPKPSSKESAILMLCDGCEGAVRALSEPTPGRIEGAVHQVVMDRLNDGQFDECDITLRELKQVELSLVKSLCGIHHGRIKYPAKSTSTGRATNGDSGETATENGSKDVPIRPERAPEVVRQA